MGRPKHIETPDDMWQLFQEYRKWCKDNPRYLYQLSNKTGEAVPVPLERPLTVVGFRAFAADKHKSVEDYFANSEGRYSAYATICRTIEANIKQDQIEGGMAGQYNPSITQRLNGLTEKTDITSGGQSISEVKVNIIRPTE